MPQMFPIPLFFFYIFIFLIFFFLLKKLFWVFLVDKNIKENKFQKKKILPSLKW